MSNRLNKKLRRLQSMQSNSTENAIMVNGYMKYKCEDCNKEWNMWLEKGIEEPGENHKPSPS